MVLESPWSIINDTTGPKSLSLLLGFEIPLGRVLAVSIARVREHKAPIS